MRHRPQIPTRPRSPHHEPIVARAQPTRRRLAAIHGFARTIDAVRRRALSSSPSATRSRPNDLASWISVASDGTTRPASIASSSSTSTPAGTGR